MAGLFTLRVLLVIKKGLNGDVCEEIKASLFSRIFKNQKSIIMKRKPENEIIIHQLCKHESVSMPELLHVAKNQL